MEKGKITSSIYYRWFAIFCLVVVGFISLGIFYYHYEADHIRDKKYDEIAAIAKLKADSIQDWRRSRLADVKRASTGYTTKREMARLLQNPTNPSTRAILQILLNINKKDTVYADAFFLGTKGNILQSDNPNLPLVDQATMKAMKLALKDRKGVLSDLFRDPKGIIYIDAIAPVPDNTGQPIAIMVLRSKAAEFLYPLIQSWPTPSKTAETLLVCREGDSVLFLNELRHRSNTALTLRFPLTDTTLPGVQAVLGNYGRILGRDYRGVDVLAVTQPVSDSLWSIVAKVDTEEILTDVKYRAWVISIIVFLLIMITAVLIMVIYRNRQEIARRKTEEALEISESKYRNIFENATEGIFQSTPEGRYISVNTAFAKIGGYNSPDEMMESVSDIQKKMYVHQEDRTRLLGLLNKHDIVTNFEAEIRRRDNAIIWISMNVRLIRDPGGNITLLEGTIADITERKQTEQELRKSEEKFRNLFDNALEGVYRTTPEGLIISANMAFARIFGYESPEEISKMVTDIGHQLYVNPEERQTSIQILRETGSLKNFECQMRRKDDSIFWVSMNAQLQKSSDGISILEGFIADINDRKQSEEKLKDTLESLRKAVNTTIQVMVSAVEVRDPYTAGHQFRSADLARAIATEIGLSQEKIDGIRMAGSIHDIGKLSIPAEILSKPTKLTNLEFSLIKEHSRSGYEMLKDVESLWPLAQIVYQHHERMDGSGYPRNLKGDEILMEARIMAVADVVESMASHRPYRPALGIDAALEEIEKNRGTIYDDAAADACLRLFREKGFQLQGARF